MSWGEDVRCLFCDGRLPLYRKLTDGQFCSAGHRKAYWVEQQRLGVERLHQFQTGSFAIPAVAVKEEPPAAEPHLEAAAPVDLTVLVREHTGAFAAEPQTSAVADGPEVTVPGFAPPLFNKSSDNGMPAAGLLTIPLRPSDERDRAMLAADPIEYEIQIRPESPNLAKKSRRQKRELSAAGLVSMAQALAVDFCAHVEPIPAEPDWLGLMAHGTPFSQAHAADFSPAKAGAEGIPWIPVDQRIDATQRAEAVRFPATSAALPIYHAQPADEMDDAIGGLIPTLVRLAPLARPEPRTDSFPHSRNEDPAPVSSEVKPCLSVFGECAPGEIGLRSLVSLALDPIPMKGAIKAEESSAIPVNLGFVAPTMAPDLPHVSVASSELRALPWSSETQPRSDWHPQMTERAVPEGFAVAIHGPVFEFQREIASFKGSSKQQKLKASKVRDDVATRAVQVPRVYFAPQPASSAPLLPVAHLEPVDAAPSQTSSMEFVFAPQRPGSAAPPPVARPKTLRREDSEDTASLMDRFRALPVTAFWRNAPRDLKMLAIALPLLIGVAIQPSLPKVRVTASVPNPEISKVVETQWNSVRRNILDRAGVELSDDFRGGLDGWLSKSDLAETWSYDQAGFVKPGPLALYEPSLKLTDYQLQFLGQISKKGLGFVYRATDLDNYYVAKLVVLKPGPLPIIGLQRYAVVNGRPGPKIEKILPITARNGMFYRVRMDIEGEYFALSVQGHLVDFWSDSRWKSGGVGFFSAPGEESRIRWVQVSHQYDALGRLCAYLAPYSAQGPAGGLRE